MAQKDDLPNNRFSDFLIYKSKCAKFAQVQTEGEREVSRNIEFYNLDAILSVGYRVNSKQATQLSKLANH